MRQSQSCPFDLHRLLRDTSLQHVEYHPSLTSTNTLAAELLEPLIARSPALVLAAEQTAGRGRRGNQWWSAAGSLTFSLVLRSLDLPLPPERRPMVAIAAGLAVRDVLASLAADLEFSLKWPNDVLTNSRKICGILVEQHGNADQQGLIIGIGVNVNNSLADAPADVSQRATSLSDLQGQPFDLTDVLIRILLQLDARISQLVSQPRLALSEANHHNILNGRVVSIQTGDSRISGTCAGIDEDGQLVLQTLTGLVRCPTGVVCEW
jgi:BirA family biotin operon repressor/biotin-[acetyl-CoA-carboxylase] ligase